ncbi:MAG: AraC family transcriptional regulator [Bacilli bacterium]|nr:AraC family transcriptional regulator [Bacilli bacterium]
MTHTEKSIKHISDNLGFMNASSFIKFFKNKTSETPLIYRKIALLFSI